MSDGSTFPPPPINKTPGPGTPPPTDQTDASAVTPGSRDLASEMKAAAEPRSGMPVKLLSDRISDAIGIGGRLRALWNYISNSSTKSMDQAKLNVVAKDYLQSNPGEVDGILREITTNTSSQDPRIVHAFVAALKGISVDFSQPVLALYSLVQRFPVDQITPDLMRFCNNFPDQAQALAERQDLTWGLSKATCDANGMLPMCKHKEYQPAILDLIDSGLFDGNGQDAQIESFLANSAVRNNLFFKDGIQRYDMPHISLPNGVEILSNFGGANSEYCKNTGKPFNQAEYLKHILDQFKKAYGSTDEAVKAFKVLVQNFAGTGNTFGILKQILDQKLIETNDEASKYSMVSNYISLGSHTVQECRSQSTMRMDEGFNIRLNVTACISGKKLQEFNKSNEKNSSFTPFSQDTIFGITVNAHIPAVISDTMDQREQQGQQTTTFGIIESFGNGDSN
ncbi:MAG: hypothetical protein LBS22_00245 [Puniceicoccales bacterium]|jgi:hypothetical protein|nr:hypothetical protein [Puniceicoccales bacterium]